MIMEAFEGFKKAKYLTMMSIKIGTCELLWMLRTSYKAACFIKTIYRNYHAMNYHKFITSSPLA